MRIRVSAVYAQSGEVLCMKYIYGGKEVFALPGGGVDKDQAVLATLADEWKNELGVKIEVSGVILVGEAPPTKRHPQTLHVIFAASEIRGNPKVRPESTHSLEVAWVPVAKLAATPLYPDVGKQLAQYFADGQERSVDFIENCMERGYW